MPLKRYSGNPILSPGKFWWEKSSVFNPGAIQVDGKIYLLYRAIGEDPLSRLGLAVSSDGFNFERRDLPVLEGDPDIKWERLGIEDPRIMEIDGRFYVTYVAASMHPMDHPRPAWSFGAPWCTRVCLAVTEDFLSYERLGVILPDSDNKDVVIFPRKVNGRYVLIHREYPNMWIAYSEDLLNWTDHKVLLEPASGKWDCNRLGAGCPPFETELGWVEIYHGVDDDRNYALGIILMDLDNPSKVIGRSPEPILFPEEPYEKEGLVPNVCFACGVVERGDQYLVYYGAADRYIGVATVGKSELMDYLKSIKGQGV